MEYLLFLISMAVFVAAIFGMEAARNRREEKRVCQSLREDYGKPMGKEYPLERFARMGSYFHRHREDGQLDDITWNDLGMDELFRRMDTTLSASGEEYLYYTLRTLRQEEASLLHLEETVRFFAGHPEERLRAQLAARRLGHMGKYSLYDYMDHLDLLGERSSGKHILCDLLFLPLVGAMWIHFSAALLGIVALVIYNIISYFQEKGEIDPYLASFLYLMRLMRSCGELMQIPVPVCGEEWEAIRAAEKHLQGMRRNSWWVMSPCRGNASGDVLSILTDYIRMVFHADLIKFNGMLKALRGHTEDVDALIGVMGYVESAIAIGAFRISLEGGEGWCVPEFTQAERIEMAEGYHPLLDAPVKNGITADRGVLLTGSNASGKSTFLKTVAVNAVLAQTVHTCAARHYRTHFFQVYSSMSLKDDILSGESYYIVEIKALKRILDAAQGKRPVLCFVDEVLRGTNTVERIAASTQILKSLGRFGILCFAATHDIELTELLRDNFCNYHFEEDIRDGDIYFHYKLRTGKAATRNAIRLLELLGYGREVVEKASAQAEHFLASGSWEG